VLAHFKTNLSDDEYCALLGRTLTQRQKLVLKRRLGLRARQRTAIQSHPETRVASTQAPETEGGVASAQPCGDADAIDAAVRAGKAVWIRFDRHGQWSKLASDLPVEPADKLDLEEVRICLRPSARPSVRPPPRPSARPSGRPAAPTRCSRRQEMDAVTRPPAPLATAVPHLQPIPRTPPSQVRSIIGELYADKAAANAVADEALLDRVEWAQFVFVWMMQRHTVKSRAMAALGALLDTVVRTAATSVRVRVFAIVCGLSLELSGGCGARRRAEMALDVLASLYAPAELGARLQAADGQQLIALHDPAGGPSVTLALASLRSSHMRTYARRIATHAEHVLEPLSRTLDVDALLLLLFESYEDMTQACAGRARAALARGPRPGSHARARARPALAAAPLGRLHAAAEGDDRAGCATETGDRAQRGRAHV
jgi:hypothetical protein